MILADSLQPDLGLILSQIIRIDDNCWVYYWFTHLFFVDAFCVHCDTRIQSKRGILTPFHWSETAMTFQNTQELWMHRRGRFLAVGACSPLIYSGLSRLAFHHWFYQYRRKNLGFLTHIRGPYLKVQPALYAIERVNSLLSDGTGLIFICFCFCSRMQTIFERIGIPFWRPSWDAADSWHPTISAAALSLFLIKGANYHSLDKVITGGLAVFAWAVLSYFLLFSGELSTVFFSLLAG